VNATVPNNSSATAAMETVTRRRSEKSTMRMPSPYVRLAKAAKISHRDQAVFMFEF
jgi:hypothetical protein